MSASNWAKCPRCAGQAAADFAAREVTITQAYGVVPADEFDAMRAKLTEDRAAFDRARPTFREDYEIWGAEDGEVKVEYGGSCAVCGLSLSFKEERTLWPA